MDGVRGVVMGEREDGWSERGVVMGERERMDGVREGW